MPANPALAGLMEDPDMFLSIDDRVENGVEFLNRSARPGWPGRIDVTRLHLDSEQCCVLGQLHDSYSQACEQLRLDKARAVELGFFAAAEDEAARQREYRQLTTAWRYRIARFQRRAA